MVLHVAAGRLGDCSRALGTVEPCANDSGNCIVSSLFNRNCVAQHVDHRGRVRSLRSVHDYVCSGEVVPLFWGDLV